MLERVDDGQPSALRTRSLDSAREASLTHVSDEEPGIRRKRAGKGFFYLDADGRRLSSPDALARVKHLAIPPAWTDVWISPDENGHIQATGRDLRGRKQYRYHQRWSLCRDGVKFSGLAAFADALPALRETMGTDLRRRGAPREKVLASIIWLLDNTMIRIGNAAYARDNKSFGLTTLRMRHVTVDGARLKFAFKGKSGKEWRIQLVDRRMAKIVRSIAELPGQQLFQYLDEDGVRRSITSHDVNAYLRDAGGAQFTSKHFRTWGGTIHAATLFSETPLPDTKTALAQTMNAVIDQVAARLGNTRAVCRSCYIHPRVIESWAEGRLAGELAAARRSFRKPISGLDDEETLIRGWLSKD